MKEIMDNISLLFAGRSPSRGRDAVQTSVFFQDRLGSWFKSTRSKKESMPVIKSDFKPAWWIFGAHQQTTWATFFRKVPKLRITNERLELDDG
jgi:hypothetical protein